MKKIDTSQPSAAAVDARMNGGYAQSSVPLVAMIVIEGVFAALSSASFASSRCSSSASMRSLMARSSAPSLTLATVVSVFVSMEILCGGGVWNEPARRGYFFFRKKT